MSDWSASESLREPIPIFVILDTALPMQVPDNAALIKKEGKLSLNLVQYLGGSFVIANVIFG